MIIEASFSTEHELKCIDSVNWLSLTSKRLEMHYMVGTMPAKHSETTDNILHVSLEVMGCKGIMTLQHGTQSVYENVRKLTITRETLVLENIVDRMAMQHRFEIKSLESLEIN
jgi:hypothetical protein